MTWQLFCKFFILVVKQLYSLTVRLLNTACCRRSVKLGVTRRKAAVCVGTLLVAAATLSAFSASVQHQDYHSTRLFANITQLLQSEVTAKSLRWIKVEHAAPTPVPTQFQSIGFFDSTHRKYKFYYTGYPENKSLYCRLYSVDAENGRLNVLVRRASRLDMDTDPVLDRKIAGGVALCGKPWTVALYFSRLFSNPLTPPVLGVLTYDSRVPDQATARAQLLHYSTHRDVALLLSEPSKSKVALNKSGTTEPSVLVCVKVHFFDPQKPANLVQLVEWLEYTRLFKADRVVIYGLIEGERGLQNDTLKVLRFYEQSGFLQLWTSHNIVASPEAAASLGWTVTLLLQAASVNFCIDYNRKQFDYVAVYDTDEIWVPLLHNSYGSLLASLSAQHGNRQFTFTNWPFFTELPQTTNDSSVPLSMRYLHRANMSHISWKTASPLPYCFVANCHLCFHSYPFARSRMQVPPQIAALHHHTNCINHRPSEECNLALSKPYIVRDDSLKRHALALATAVNRTLKTLGEL